MAKKLILVILILAAFIVGCEDRKKTNMKERAGDGPQAIAISASITLNANGSCQQNNGNAPFAYIDVSKGGLDTVSWSGGINAATRPTVTFLSAAPFAQSSYSGGGSTVGGAVNGTAGNIYAFQTVQVWDTSVQPYVQKACSNPQSMGVHVTQ